MKSRVCMTSLLFVAVLVGPALAQRPGAKAKPAGNEPMPVYVTPFYNSEGLKIDVGPYSKQLAAADAKTIGEVVAKLKKDQDKLRAEVMYVAAIRLYDLGHKDEAVYWFYAAQYRGRLFTFLLDPAQVGSIGSEAFELKQAYNAFNQLAGTYINGYAFGDLKKLEKTLQQVIEEQGAAGLEAGLSQSEVRCRRRLGCEEPADVRRSWQDDRLHAEQRRNDPRPAEGQRH